MQKTAQPCRRKMHPGSKPVNRIAPKTLGMGRKQNQMRNEKKEKTIAHSRFSYCSSIQVFPCLVARDKTLETRAKVSLAGSNFKVPVNNTANH